MTIHTRALVHALLLLICVVHFSQPVCVDVPSEKEAVVGQPMRLTCIFCMKREEVNAKTRVDWSFHPSKGMDIKPEAYVPIYLYENGQPQEVEGPWQGHLIWNGSKDLQDISIRILNVTLNHSGTYRCQVFRQFEFDFFTPSITKDKVIELSVKEKAIGNITALYSEIMMYLLLVFLTFWLLVEMVYCYRKISKSDEQAQDTALSSSLISRGQTFVSSSFKVSLGNIKHRSRLENVGDTVGCRHTTNLV